MPDDAGEPGRAGSRPSRQSVDRLIQYLDKQIAADANDIRFRLFKVQLLIALDRPKDLQQALEGLIKAGKPTTVGVGPGLPVGRARPPGSGHYAVRGDRRADNELGPTDYRTLADWYMAVGRKDDYAGR